MLMPVFIEISREKKSTVVVWPKFNAVDISMDTYEVIERGAKRSANFEIIAWFKKWAEKGHCKMGRSGSNPDSNVVKKCFCGCEFATP